MKGACHKCGAPLKKGNIKVVRPRGKKRPWRECRRCPEVKPQSSFLEIAHKYKPPGNASALFGTAGNGLQRPQDTTGGPVTYEGVFAVEPPTRYRFFMTQDQAARVRERLAKTILIPGFGVGFEVIPVPDYQVEADPDAFADLVEVKVEWKNE